MKVWVRLFILGVALSFFPAKAFKTFERGTFVRDAEIESILKKILHPIFKVAKLNPKAAKIYIIIDPDLNAAAGLGYRIFINSGLLIKADSVAEVAGVLAHETGHIASGHLMRRMDAIGRASLLRMAGYALGAAAAILSGHTDALVAGVLGSDNAAVGTILKYSRGQESAADQAGVRYMQQLGWPVQGFLGMMEKLLAQDLLSASYQEPYMRTHPLNQERVSFLKNVVATTAQPSQALPYGFEEDFRRAQAKLKAYTLVPGQVLLEFSERRQDNLALYARAIAFYRDRNITQAVRLLKQLLAASPDDPYIWEMLGIIFFEEGRIIEAQSAYEKAYTLAPHEPLIQMAYAQSLLESKNPHHLQQAVALMEKVVKVEDDYGNAWHFLAVAYGKTQKPAYASYALAKEAVCLEKYEIALQQIERALKGQVSAPMRQKLKDLKEFVLNTKDEKEEELFTSPTDLTS